MATQIKADALIADFRHMLDNKWGYIFGASGQVLTQEEYEKKSQKNEWTKKYGKRWIGHHVADCSGAFVWAYKQHGRSIYHGVNRIAREYVVELLPVSAAEPGMAAFKVYRPGDKLYELPDDCKPGHAHYNGDLNDYHHIGLVDSDPDHVIEAATTQIGVRVGNLSDRWDYVARLKAVNYDGGDEPVAEEQEMIVVAKSGKTVNMRQGPGTGNPVICRVSIGSHVMRITDTDGWAFIRLVVDGRTGYMRDKYLEPVPDPAPQPVTPSYPAELIALLEKALEANAQEKAALEQMQAIITGGVG